jgi:rhodanese-related sulfurtransferase
MPGVATVSVQELRQMLAQNTPPLLLDGRELEEWQFCRIEGARQLPMSQTQHRVRTYQTVISVCAWG